VADDIERIRRALASESSDAKKEDPETPDKPIKKPAKSD
jgi:hypothetical protein